MRTSRNVSVHRNFDISSLTCRPRACSHIAQYAAFERGQLRGDTRGNSGRSASPLSVEPGGVFPLKRNVEASVPAPSESTPPPAISGNAGSIFIIVGAPRSGTSALASVLIEQGIPMWIGADAPTLASPTGNQEDALVRTIHNHLMGKNGMACFRNWDNPQYVRGSTDRAIRLLRAYMRCRSRQGGTWGVKDPRLCFLIEPWHAATLRASVHWIHIYREDRDAMIRSLTAMLPAGLRLVNDARTLYHLVSNWAEVYTLAIELGFARTGVKPFHISYEELLTFDGQTRLSQCFGFRLPFLSLRPELNRQGKARFRYASDPRARRWMRIEFAAAKLPSTLGS